MFFCIHELVFKTLVYLLYIYIGDYITQLYRNRKGIPRIPKKRHQGFERLDAPIVCLKLLGTEPLKFTSLDSTKFQLMC